MRASARPQLHGRAAALADQVACLSPAVGEDVNAGADEFRASGRSRRIGGDANTLRKRRERVAALPHVAYAVRPFSERPSAACAAARRAIGMRKGEHET